MAALHHPFFGTIDFDDSGWAELSPVVDGTTLSVSIEAQHNGPTEDEVDALADACRRHRQLGQRVLDGARGIVDDIVDAFSVWIDDVPALLAKIDPEARTLDDVARERFIEVLGLKEIRLHAGSKVGPIVFDFEYELDALLDGQVVAGHFCIHLKKLYVTMES